VKQEKVLEIIDKVERGGVYNAEKHEWMTPKDAVNYIEDRAQKGDNGARMATNVMRNMQDSEKEAWAACAMNIHSVAKLLGKGDYEIDVGIVINICNAHNADDFLYGYLQAKIATLSTGEIKWS